MQHLQLQSLRPKTIEAYARAMRRIGQHFDYQVTALSAAQLTDYLIQSCASIECIRTIGSAYSLNTILSATRMSCLPSKKMSNNWL